MFNRNAMEDCKQIRTIFETSVIDKLGKHTKK